MYTYFIMVDWQSHKIMCNIDRQVYYMLLNEKRVHVNYLFSCISISLFSRNTFISHLFCSSSISICFSSSFFQFFPFFFYDFMTIFVIFNFLIYLYIQVHSYLEISVFFSNIFHCFIILTHSQYRNKMKQSIPIAWNNLYKSRYRVVFSIRY